MQHAPLPQQTVNVDLCFVPAVHAAASVVPAVSGSSGKLILCHRAPEGGERSWPGKVFACPEVSYTGAMDQFVAARQAKLATKATKTAIMPPDPTIAGNKAARQAWSNAWQRLQISRREERVRRHLSNQIWQERRREHTALQAAVRDERLAGSAGWRVRAGNLAAQWRAAWGQRHQEFAHRRQVDARWREQSQDLRRRSPRQGPDLVWVAILVIVDNCTRQSLELPLFTLGAHVTADLLVHALRTILPPQLAYLIADGGSHFGSTALAKLATDRGFVRVPLAPYRPQSNGIAERFIETLKAWLASHPWNTPEELRPLLAEFRTYYNDRPHQATDLAGLSPNEYAVRKAAL